MPWGHSPWGVSQTEAHMATIPNRKPRRRVVSMKSLVFAIEGNERAYPVYKFSDRQVFERPNHNPFQGL